ncbi:MAG: FliM/FliN family flagellar motor switch protein [Terracidiphilus sp.]|jgi:flagellar motor switch protein FliN/FliY
MKSYLDCWTGTATALFSQALAGEPQLTEGLPKPLAANSFGFAATVGGDLAGRFAVVLDGSVLDSPLMGEGTNQKAGWEELLREVAESAVGELLATTGKKCRIEKFEATAGESKISRAFQLKAGDRAWTILVRDEVRAPQVEAKPETMPDPLKPAASAVESPGLSRGVELLLDVELDATLRFGCREMPLGEILDLGPGDVVQLDRHIADPVDLIVGDKIVARGEVVLINGNFGLRVTEVSAPKKRLESIRCLF